MKFKKEIYTIGILFVFILGYYLGLNNSEKNIQDENNVEVVVEREQDFAKQNPASKKEEQKKESNKKSEKKELYKVWDVVDGDTIKIFYKGNKTSVRILGMNTPEKKNPFRPQECFGEEASKRAKEILWGKKVYIETDPSQSKFDKHGRLLAYVIMENGEDFGEKMIREGYAYEYTYHGRKYKNQKKYKEVQKYAEENELGLWNPDTCNGEK